MEERPLIVGMISTWNDGPLLRSAVRSLIGTCDHVFVCDGAYDAVAEKHNRWSVGSRPGGMYKVDIDNVSYIRPHISRVRTQVTKRTLLLDLAIEWAAGRDAWGLTLDADEMLIFGAGLRDELRAAQSRIYRIPSFNVQTGQIWDTARIVRLREGMCYGDTHWTIVLPDGFELDISHHERRDPIYPGMPCILHRRYLRDPERLKIGDALRRGEYDNR
jgi:hypothetical protein